MEGFESERAAWEQQYADAQSRWEAHKEQVRRSLEEESQAGAEAPASGGSTYSSEAPASDGGTLASDEALAALREKLTGN